MKVKVSLAAGTVAGLAAAAPVAEPIAAADPVPAARPQPQGKGGGASGVCFVFARGSTEPAPLGMLIGPQLQGALKGHFPSMKTYPVMYAASIATNISMDRTDAASIAKGVSAFKEAQGCTTIVAGGYSQGAAVMHNVVGKSLDAGIKAKIAGVALFGDTRNAQDKGHIPNFPTERSKVWCNPSDGVCGGGLMVNAGHLSYSGTQIKQAADWLAGRVKSGGSGGDAGESSEESSPAKGKSGGRGKMGGKARFGRGSD